MPAGWAVVVSPGAAVMKGAVAAGELASESGVFFSGKQRLRIADLRRLPAGPLASRPLVFLNACEGATQDAFYYDGFMPFFIEQQLARCLGGPPLTDRAQASRHTSCAPRAAVFSALSRHCRA